MVAASGGPLERRCVVSKANGKPFRIPYLLAQARYAIGAVKGDAAVAKAVGVKTIASLETETSKLEGLVQAAARVRNSAVLLAAEEDAHGLQAQRWITMFRRLYSACRRSARPELPALPRRNSRDGSTVLIATEMSRMLETATNFASVLTSWDVTTEFIAEGMQIVKALLATDQKQQSAFGPARAEVVNHIRNQGIVVHGLLNKVVAIARYTHRSNPGMRRQYTLKVLYGVPTDSNGREPSQPEKIAS